MMTPIFGLGATVTADTHTERFLLLRRIERDAAAGLADAMADVGEQLLQIRMDLASSGERGWTKWLKAQAGRATEMGISAVTDRTASNYMALARFRATTGKRFPELMTLSISCLYPILTLPDSALADLAANGVPVEGGGTKPLAEASARELKQAAGAIRRGMKSGAPAPLNVFQRAYNAIKGLGPLTPEQKAKLAELLEMAPVAAAAPAAPAPKPTPAPAPSPIPAMPAAPVQIPTGAAAPVTPPRAPELENVLQVIPGVVRAVEGLKAVQ